MDEALGFETAALDAAIQMQSCVMDAFESASMISPTLVSPALFSPVLGNLLDLTAQTITLWVELQLSWLAMMTPHAIEKTETSSHVAASRRKAVSHVLALPMSASPMAGPEHHMDIAIGAWAA
jgi:hypothetical protein